MSIFTYGLKDKILDYCLHPGRLSAFLILLCILIIFGAWRADVAQEKRYVAYCMGQDARLTEEDCYWKYDAAQAAKPKTTVIPLVVPMR